MDEQQLFEEFAEDTLNSKMSIGAFTLYSRCYIARLLFEIEELKKQLDHVEYRCVGACFEELP